MFLPFRFIIIIIFTTLLFLSNNAGAISDSIFIDGDFQDWNATTLSYTDTTGDGGSSKIDFGKIWIANSQEKLFVRFEIGQERIIQSNSNIKLYIDSDNSLITGFNINGIGADIVWDFSNRSGTLYHSGSQESIIWNRLSLISAPTFSGNEFEISISRLSVFNDGSPIFANNNIRIVLKSFEGSYDLAPNSGSFIIYQFDTTSLPPYPHIPLAKKNNSHIRILTWNVLADGLFSRTQNFSRILKAINPQILNFQEIYNHTASEAANLITTILPVGQGEQWYSAKGTIDIITLSRFPITQQVTIDGNLAVLIDLPDGQFADKILIINAHLPCCSNEVERQAEADNIMSFIRKSKLQTGGIPISQNTPILVLGDLNLVGEARQIKTLLTGDILNEGTYGPDFQPDWDLSSLTALTP